MISYRLPFIEVTVKGVLDLFGIKYTESNEFSCCPEPNGIKNSDLLTYNVTASRNLAIAEKNGKHILTPCNGCFETLKGVRSEIKIDQHFRNKMNLYLEKISLNVEGASDVYHLIEFFHKLGKDIIKDKIKYKLNGLRVAVHYGCHFLRPSHKIQMDDPMEPHIFDELIEDLGAKSIDYVHKMDCCGGSLSRADNPESGLEMVHSKLEAIKEANIDVIVVGCPQCFVQFDHLQRDLKKLDYHFDIPVLYYSELLALALGLNIKKMIQKYHRTPVESIFKKIDMIRRKNNEIKKFFDLEFLKKCYSCGACNNDCPVAKFLPQEFNPQNIIGKILEGKISDLVRDPSIWLCLDCYVCYELCPMRIGLVEIFTILRNIAKKRGFIPDGFRNELDSFKKEGIVAMFSRSARKRVGLDTVKPDIKDLKILFNEINHKKRERQEI